MLRTDRTCGTGYRATEERSLGHGLKACHSRHPGKRFRGTRTGKSERQKKQLKKAG